MAKPPRSDPRAGGALLAISVVAGALGGAIGGQASVGVLAGLAVGLVLLLGIWWSDRRRR
jgi:hypothetical protein